MQIWRTLPQHHSTHRVGKTHGHCMGVGTPGPLQQHHLHSPALHPGLGPPSATTPQYLGAGRPSPVPLFARRPPPCPRRVQLGAAGTGVLGRVPRDGALAPTLVPTSLAARALGQRRQLRVRRPGYQGLQRLQHAAVILVGWGEGQGVVGMQGFTAACLFDGCPGGSRVHAVTLDTAARRNRLTQGRVGGASNASRSVPLAVQRAWGPRQAPCILTLPPNPQMGLPGRRAPGGAAAVSGSPRIPRRWCRPGRSLRDVGGSGAPGLLKGLHVCAPRWAVQPWL